MHPCVPAQLRTVAAAVGNAFAYSAHAQSGFSWLRTCMKRGMRCPLRHSHHSPLLVVVPLKTSPLQAARGELQVSLVVKDKKQLSKINYANQGDATFYSNDMIKVPCFVGSHGHAASLLHAWEGLDVRGAHTYIYAQSRA